MAGEIASLYAKVTADVSQYQREMKKVKDDLPVLSKGFTGLQNLLGTGLKVAAGAAVTGIGALAAGIGAATKSAADMEQQIANINAVMGLSSEQTVQLKDLIKDLGLDPKLKVSAVEAAQAIEMLGKNGLTMDQVMAGAAESAILLANATNDNFALAADVATDVMAQFNIDAAEMGRAVDGIVGVTNASKFSIDDYALAIAQAGGVAGSVGVSFDDFNAAIAATSPSFASGSDAGTSFKTFLQRLVPQTDKAEDALNRLGLQAGGDGVAGAFFTADGAMRPMSEIAENLQNAFDGLSESQKIEAASTIFGTDAMRTALALAEGGGEIIDKMKGIIGNTSAEEAAKTRMDTLAGAWEVFMGVVETLTLSIGEQFLPIARDVVEWVTEMASTHGPKLIAWATQLAGAVSFLLENWGGLPIAFEDGSGLLSEFLEKLGVAPKLAQDVGYVLYWLVESFQQLIHYIFETDHSFAALTDLVTNLPVPFKELGAQIGFVGGRIYDLVAPIVEAIGNFVTWQDVLTALGLLVAAIVVPALVSIVTAIAPVIALVGGAILAVAALRTAWETDFGGIQEKTRAVLGYVQDRFGPLFDVIKAFGGDALREIADWAMGNDTNFEAVGRIWETAKETARTLFEDLKRFVTDNYPIWRDKLLEWGGAAWTWLRDVAIPMATQKLGEWGGALLDWLGDHLGPWAEKLGQWAAAAWEWLRDTAIPMATQKLGEWGSALFGWLSEHLQPWGDKLAQWAAAAWEWIRDTAIPMATTKLGEWGTALFTWLSTNLQPWAEKLGEWAAAAWTWIRDTAIPMATTKLGEWGTALFGWITNNLPGWREKLAGWATAAWKWITETAIPQAIAKLGEWGKALFGWLADNLPDLIAKLLDWAIALVTWIADAAPKAIHAFGDWLEGILRWGDEQGDKGFLDMVGKWIGILWEWVMTDLWPALEPKLTELGKAIVEALGLIGEALWEEVKDIGAALLDGMQKGISDKWQDFIEWVGDKWEGIIDIFKNLFAIGGWQNVSGLFVSFGAAILDGLQKGISDKWTDFTTWIGGKWSGMIGGFKNFFGIHSPSTLFAGFGEDIMTGLQNGMADKTAGVVGVLDTLSSDILGKIDGLATNVSAGVNEINSSIGNIGATFPTGGGGSSGGGGGGPTGGGGTSPTPNMSGAQALLDAANSFFAYPDSNPFLANLDRLADWMIESVEGLSDMGSLTAEQRASFEMAAPVFAGDHRSLEQSFLTEGSDKIVDAIFKLIDIVRMHGGGPTFGLNLLTDVNKSTIDDIELRNLADYLYALYGA